MQGLKQFVLRGPVLIVWLLASTLVVGCSDSYVASSPASQTPGHGDEDDHHDDHDHDDDHDHEEDPAEVKILTPLRVTQVSGHADVEQLVGFATGNEIMYVIYPEDGLYEETVWADVAGAQRHLHLFDAHGEHFLVLDKQGTLHVLETADWSLARSIAAVSADSIDAGAKLTVSQQDDLAFVSDPENDRIRQIDLESGAISDIAAGFTPSSAGVVWTGVGLIEEHAHEHKAEDEHDHDGHDMHPGRLIVANSGDHAHVYIYDLEDGVWLNDLHLDFPPHAIHASPEYRYAVVTQRDTGGSSNQVRFIDSGIWWHVDHGHADTPAMLDLVLYGQTPAHYRAVGEQATLFFDAGDGPRFVLFTDESLAEGSIVATENILAAHHGIAEPRGGVVISSTPERDGVIFHELHNDHFHDEGRSEESCLSLHGGGSNAHWSGFGCDDGVLLIGELGEADHDHHH